MKSALFLLTFIVILLTAISVTHSTSDSSHSSRSQSSSASSSSSDSGSASPSLESSSGSNEDEEAFKEKGWDETNEPAHTSEKHGPCPSGMFYKGEKCRYCSQCGPDLYIRQHCTSEKDTLCDWCLNPTPLKNRDFRLKCIDYIKLQKDFRKMVDQRGSSSGDSQEITVVQPVLVHHHAPAGHYSYPQFSIHAWNAWKLEMVLEVCFYLALIALVFVVIRLISKSRPYYRTVTVSPPMLDEADNKNIIRAVEQIREKLGKKGYDRLEEFI